MTKLGSVNSNKTHLNETKVPIITVNANYQSVYGHVIHSMTNTNGMFISNRQTALNFRHRVSEAGYESDWHVAGDPTLIIIQQGQLELILRDNNRYLFSAGEQFIAADYLPDGKSFTSVHGHKAKVIGQQTLHAVHIKLSNQPVQWLNKNNQLSTDSW